MNALEKLIYNTGSALQRLVGAGPTEIEKPVPERKRAKAFSVYLSSLAETGRYVGQYGQYGSYFQDQAQRRAIQNSWVFTAVTFIAREISAAEIELVEHDITQKEPITRPEHEFLKLLRKPNAEMGTSFLWQFTTMWLELSGNAYWFIVLDTDHKPIEIWPLPSNFVNPVPGNDVKLIEYYEYSANGKLFHIPPEFIIHIKLPNPHDMFRGLSPLMAAILAVDTDNSMSMWNNNLFNRDNIMPSAIINIKPLDPSVPIDEADIEALKEDLRGEYQAAKRKTAIVTAGDLSIEKLEWSPFELDFKGSRQFSQEEIYQVYGIPTGLLDNANVTGAGNRAVDQIFKEKTIWPTLGLIAEQINAQLVTIYWGNDFEARFKDIRPVNRQLELQDAAAAAAYFTIDEIRAKYWHADPMPNKRGAYRLNEPPTMISQILGLPAGTTPPTPPSNNLLGMLGGGNGNGHKPTDEGAHRSDILHQFLPGQESLAQQGLPTGGTPLLQKITAPKIPKDKNGLEKP